MIFFLVEDYSMKQFLEGILPRLDFAVNTFEIKHHNGKEDLLGSLTKVIPTLSKRAQHIVVLIDRDQQNCIELKNKIKEKMTCCSCPYTLRIACYELETWFLGDLNAIAQCSERFKPKYFENKDKFKAVDNIAGKPSAKLEEMMPDWKNLYSSKPKFAEKISRFITLELNHNRSHSFRVFLKTLYELKHSNSHFV